MMHTIFRVIRTTKDAPAGHFVIHSPTGTACFDKEVTVEYAPCSALTVTVESVGILAYLRCKIRQPLLRWLLYIPAGILWLLQGMVLFFLATYGEGIRKDELFAALSPFAVKSTLTLHDPDGKTVDITLQKAVYSPSTNRYTPPILTLSAGTADTVATFSTRQLKRSLLCHIVPGFCLLFLLCGGLCTLCGAILAKVIREVALNTLLFNIVAITGMVASCALMLFALVSVIRLFCQLYKQCDSCQTA